MILEDYVSFETAKLLKEKGFNESCTHVCNIESGKILEADFYTCKYVYNSWLDKNEPQLIAVPTIQMAMKWLREVHSIHIILDIHWLYFANTLGWMYTINKILENGTDYIDSKGDENDKNFYSTYEEAAEVAIKYCLENLI